MAIVEIEVYNRETDTQFAAVRMDDVRVASYIQKHEQAGTWGKPGQYTITQNDVTEVVRQREEAEVTRKTALENAISRVAAARPPAGPLKDLFDYIMIRDGIISANEIAPSGRD